MREENTERECGGTGGAGATGVGAGGAADLRGVGGDDGTGLGALRWLSPDERHAWLTFGALMMRLPGALDAQLQRDAGISHFEYLVLAMLSESSGRTLRMSQLAALANGSLSRLSHVVSRLERRGWVRRAACPNDGRATNAILTDEGWAKVVQTAPGHVERVRSLVIDALSPAQLGQLGEIAAVVLDRVDAEPERA